MVLRLVGSSWPKNIFYDNLAGDLILIFSMSFVIWKDYHKTREFGDRAPKVAKQILCDS
jgi:hypothetical protein